MKHRGASKLALLLKIEYKIIVMSGRKNNPNQWPVHHFTARIGRHTTFSAYVAFYEHAVEKLFRQVSEQNETADLTAIPLLFLMRHTIELGYKFSLFHLCELNGTSFTPEAKNAEGHSFEKLHARLRLEYTKALSDGHVNEKDNEIIDEYFVRAENGIRLFDAIDDKSTKFRFPIDKQTPVFTEDTEVNLLELKDACDQAMELLGTVIDVIARPWVYYG
jgi:hypothetical protein